MQQPSGDHSTQRGRTAVKLALVTLVVAGAAVVFLTPVRDHLTLEAVRALIATMQTIWYAPIIFVLAFAIASIVFVPASIFVIPAGLIWGWGLGFLYALLGALIGAFASFAIAKYVGGGVLAHFGEKGAKVTRTLDHAGFKTLLILRLIPLWPFPLLNYAAGIAGVKYRDFLAATALGLCPGLFIMTFSADALANGTLTGPQAFQRLLLLGLVVGLLILIPNLFRKRAARTLHIDDETVGSRESSVEGPHSVQSPGSSV